MDLVEATSLLPAQGFDPSGSGLARIEGGGVVLYHDGSEPAVMRCRIDELARRLAESEHSIEPPPVTHEVVGGLYVRRLFIPKGILLVGRIHLKPCVNIVEKGALTVLTELGCAHLTAGWTGVSLPGTQKVGLTYEDTVFTNVFRTDETDIARIEAETTAERGSAVSTPEADRLDYAMFLQEAGLTEEQVRAVSHDMSDHVHIPQDSFYIAPSPIEGEGVFARHALLEGEIVGPARLGTKRTLLGRKTNHSMSPNCEPARLEDGVPVIVARRAIDKDEELTLDYREVVRFNTELNLQEALQ